MPMYFFASSYYFYILINLNYLFFACLFHIHFHYLHMPNLLHMVVQYIQSILLSLLLCHYTIVHQYISFQFHFLFLHYRMQVYLFLYYTLLPLCSIYDYLLNFLMFHLMYLLVMFLFHCYTYRNMLRLFLHNTLYLNNSLNLLDSIHLLHNHCLHLIHYYPMINLLNYLFLLI